MTSYVHWLKVAQDNPVSVAHLRALDESAETILRYNKAAVFSQACSVSVANDMGATYEGPDCYWPGDVQKYKIALCYDVTSSAVTASTIYFSVPDFGGFVTGSATITPTTSGTQHYTFDVEPVGAFNTFDFKGFGRFKFKGGENWPLFYIGCFAWYDEYESSIPYQGEIADSIHFSNILKKIEKAYSYPHYLYGFTGSYQLQRDAISNSSEFRMAFAYDYQDNRLSASACQFRGSLLASMPNGGAAATHFGYIMHQDSGDSVSGSMSAATQSGIGVLFNGTVSGISYKKTSGYSHIHIDAASDDSPRPYLKGMALHAIQNDYQASRYNDSGYNTLASLQNYESGDIVTATMFNAAARALFNIGFHTAGPPMSAVAPDGTSSCNYSSYTTVLCFPIMTRNHWLMGKRDRDYLKFHYAMTWYNSGASRTNYLRFTTDTNGYTATDSFTIGGPNVETVNIGELEIQKDDKDADFLWLEMDIYQSSIVPPSITAYSFWLAPLTTSYTP